MAVITIREQNTTETGFDATLVIEGNNYQITLSDPFTAQQEQELEWYFENWLSQPLLDNVKADRAKTSVREYGKSYLSKSFKQILKPTPNTANYEVI